MKWSLTLGRIAGIEVRMHLTFLALLAYVGIDYYLVRGAWSDVIAGLAFIFALFGIVVLHELGHALAARRYGIRTRDITLLPIGGVARLERMPEDPKQELVVALAGPAVNVVLAAVLGALLVPTAAAAALLDWQIVGGSFLGKLVAVNVTLALFNLVPAFPMDGGRVLRALLAMRRDYVWATRTAASVGQALAVGFGFLGLVAHNPFLILIALFVWVGAAEEANSVALRSALAGIPVSRAMITDFRTLAPTDDLGQAVEHVLAGFQQDFPVVDGESRVIGILTQPALLRALARSGTDGRIAETMDRAFAVAEPGEMTDRVLARLAACACRSIPVVSGGRLVGLVTPDNVSELILIEAALRDARRRHVATATAA